MKDGIDGASRGQNPDRPKREKNERRQVKTIGTAHTCCIKTTINYVRAQLILLLMFVYWNYCRCR
jgi:hypothetical protein